MADLIGLCIDNTNSITETIGVTLKVNERMSNIKKIMDLEQKAHEEKPTSDILKELDRKFVEIKQKSVKLIEDRIKEKA